MLLFSGKVCDLSAYLAERLYPGKVISLKQYKKKKTVSTKTIPTKTACKIFNFSIPDSIA